MFEVFDAPAHAPSRPSLDVLDEVDNHTVFRTMTEEPPSYPQWLYGVIQTPLVRVCQRNTTNSTCVPQS